MIFNTYYYSRCSSGTGYANGGYEFGGCGRMFVLFNVRDTGSGDGVAQHYRIDFRFEESYTDLDDRMWGSPDATQGLQHAVAGHQLAGRFY